MIISWPVSPLVTIRSLVLVLDPFSEVLSISVTLFVRLRCNAMRSRVPCILELSRCIIRLICWIPSVALAIISVPVEIEGFIQLPIEING